MSEDSALKTAVDLIAKFEGFRPKPYQDVAGVWTIGYGQTYLDDGGRVTASTPPVTEAQAREWMTAKVAGKYMPAVQAMVHVPITGNQVSALTSFAYNLGTAALRNSTLMRLLNEGRTQDAAIQFGAWVKAGGYTVEGLVRRRAEEKALFLSDAPLPVAPTAPVEMTADDLNAQVLTGLHNA